MTKKLLILSGKGGTGKTTTAAAFIRFAQAKAFADCDVDAPNLHLVQNLQEKPEISDYHGSDKAFIDEEMCTRCGLCARRCRFQAIRRQMDGTFQVDEFACEGCGVCEFTCPVKAVTMKPDVSGWLSLTKGNQVFSTAKLKMGRGNSGKLVSQVKLSLFRNAPEAELAIIDGSPGIGCPVIASISGMDLVLIVTEPSLSGLSDLSRLFRTAGIFQAKTAVCINRADVCPEETEKIKAFCTENNIPFLGYIPYDPAVPAAVNAGKSIADVDCPARDALRQVFDRAVALLG